MCSRIYPTYQSTQHFGGKIARVYVAKSCEYLQVYLWAPAFSCRAISSRPNVVLTGAIMIWAAKVWDDLLLDGIPAHCGTITQVCSSHQGRFGKENVKERKRKLHLNNWPSNESESWRMCDIVQDKEHLRSNYPITIVTTALDESVLSSKQNTIS